MYLRFLSLRLSQVNLLLVANTYHVEFNFLPTSLPLLFAALHWIQEEKITLFTADGLIQFGGNIVPRRVSFADATKARKIRSAFQISTFHESKYMDPNQSLCLGALIDIAATNMNTGLDMGRKLCILGYCRCSASLGSPSSI
ncbi:LOW QUALITY PROTEIN: uncharacterized protein LOC132629785 [Lycium barbarum]|uniref:LOW QUALITY PROTEIN: uncharacterized protein LOC132629785 n=1 Tax=Lycium barbarum TaxID=112863 RepID=UPI00293F17B7|nr:LOW QUALITY PROTEIN: uncharacterized protein LOC132629785 [Lycium barbarum]